MPKFSLIMCLLGRILDPSVGFISFAPNLSGGGRFAVRSSMCPENADDADSADNRGSLPTLVYQNDWMVAIDKPAGMSYHSEFEDGVVKTVRQLQTAGTLDYDGEIHSVHRLDRVTSGLLIFAKNQDAASRLSLAFQEKTVQKFYVAITDQKPNKKMGTISGDMSKSRRSQWKLLRSTENPAVTRFLSQPISFANDGKRQAQIDSGHIFLLRPLTGKTHQLRVAVKALGAPILGDPLYNTASASADRCYLHACAIRINASDGYPAVQLILKPKTGDLFTGSAFDAAWNSFILPNMIVQEQTDGQEALIGRNMLACLLPDH